MFSISVSLSMLHLLPREENENLRLLYVGCTRARQKLVFAHRSGKYALLALLPTVDMLLNPELDAGEHKLDGIETTFLIRHLAADLAEGLSVPAAEQSAWISQESVVLAAVIAPRFHSPSQAEPVPNGTTFDITELPGTSFFPPKAEEAEYAAIGNAFHSYMAALPSIRTLADADKVLVAERCLSTYSVSAPVPPTVLVSAGERFRNWVESTYPEAIWHVEVPVSGPRSQGGEWAGTAELVLQLPGGAIVNIDHKSAPIRREHCAKKATEFAGQLSAYSEAFQQAGTSINSMWIHFPLAGVVGQAKVR
jgi:ATP-dependent helicase/nuclease subunit A